MNSHQLPSEGTVKDRALGFGDLRSEALHCFAAVTVVVGWLLNLIDMLFRANEGPITVGFVVSLWLLAVGAIAWRLGQVDVTLAGTLLAGGMCAALTAVVIDSPNSPAKSLFALVVIVSAAIGGPRHGFAWAIVASLLVNLGEHVSGSTTSESTGIALTLIWGTAFACWLAFRPAYVAAEWAWASYDDALRLSQELRVRQGELGQLSKSLNEACDRLEQQNVVLERARLAAEEARRLKAEFAASISHELRTPVNLIVGVSEMMMMESETGVAGDGLPASYREDVGVIYRNACHVSHLIDDILDLSQVDAHRMALVKEQVRLAEVVEQATSALATQFQRKGLYLRTDLPEDLPCLRADPTRLRQVLMNLLSNAARFTDCGGVTIGATAQEREVVVSVADTGVGIPPDEASSIFEEFRQTGPVKSRRGGSGLGLAVSKRIVELHGGNMWVTSSMGQGSTFYFSLPLADSVAASPISTDLDVYSRAVADGARTLVVVGTDQHATRVIQRYLDDYRVLAVPSAEQARGLMQDGGVDALLVTSTRPTSRVQFPQDGQPDAPVIYCALRTTRTLAHEVGVAEYLVKPMVREQLQAALRRLRRRIRRVLVVEDDPDMRRMLARMVRAGSRGREVWESADGQEALKLLRIATPDVVLLDLLMPEMDGYTFLERARSEELLPDVPVVVITAKGYEPEAVVASELTITRGERGMTVGELARALRASLNVLLDVGRASPTRPVEDTAAARPAVPAV